MDSAGSVHRRLTLVCCSWRGSAVLAPVQGSPVPSQQGYQGTKEATVQQGKLRH